MKRILSAFFIAIAGIATLSCNKEPEMQYAENGPEMTINSYTEKVNMGSMIKFSVSVSDSEYDLSTVKARLLFDETEVGAATIRTKENGTYEDAILVPLMKGIPDGIATVEFIAQNVGLAKTIQTVAVDVSRPNPKTVVLVDAEGKEYTMTKTADYKYSYSALLPQKFSVYAQVPSLVEGEPIVLGWNGSELEVNAKNPIPFSATEMADYTVSIDLENLTAEPFNMVVKTVSNLSESNNTEVLTLRQNRAIEFKGIPEIKDWELDRDFFKLDEDKNVIFLAVNGRYRLTADFKNTFIKVEPVDENDKPLTLGADGTGGLWMIGANFGKPSIGPGWNTTDGAYATAQVSPKIFQITFNVGSQLGEKPSLKFFHQKGWGGEYKAYSKVNDATGIFTITGGGNIELQSGKSLVDGRAYQFIVDLTQGVDSPVLSIKEVAASEGKALDIQVNGVKADKISKTVYKVKALELKKNSVISFSGIDNPLEWYVDPDHFIIDASGLKFNAVNGYYSIELDLADKYVTVRRVKKDGKSGTFKDEGAITFMGWGVAHPFMTKQLAWDNGSLITLAEVEEGLYQFTGIAVEDNSTRMGGRLRYNDMSFKLFGQAGWGTEMSKDYVISAGAQALGFVNKGNIELGGKANDSALEIGATYRMTFRFDNKTLVDNKFTFTFDCVKL